MSKKKKNIISHKISNNMIIYYTTHTFFVEMKIKLVSHFNKIFRLII